VRPVLDGLPRGRVVAATRGGLAAVSRDLVAVARRLAPIAALSFDESCCSVIVSE
jgi:hypothetical protein